MMASPIAPKQLIRLDLVLCTYWHTDNMIPDTLQPLAAAFPDLRFIVPGALLSEAARRWGASVSQVIDVNASEDLKPLGDLHEQRFTRL